MLLLADGSERRYLIHCNKASFTHPCVRVHVHVQSFAGQAQLHMPLGLPSQQEVFHLDLKGWTMFPGTSMPLPLPLSPGVAAGTGSAGGGRQLIYGATEVLSGEEFIQQVRLGSTASTYTCRYMYAGTCKCTCSIQVYRYMYAGYVQLRVQVCTGQSKAALCTIAGPTILYLNQLNQPADILFDYCCN